LIKECDGCLCRVLNFKRLLDFNSDRLNVFNIYRNWGDIGIDNGFSVCVIKGDKAVAAFAGDVV